MNIGRRACPGAVLAKRIIGHTLGALIHCFEFDRVGNEEINMKERLGLTMPKVEPLVVLCGTSRSTRLHTSILPKPYQVKN
ncbi:hypothetical protein Ahy_B03g067631 [Arachis hypogaea]|uniref:Cytochrome P450 n=1 Tax=Arachis hypogaea TaxID=3818 RepID=A0A445A7B4_ARAHY|nr:hypothetical protein Ahy_B03g067631 [Arachis hypogaea]